MDRYTLIYLKWITSKDLLIIQRTLLNVMCSILVSLVCMPSSRIAGSYGSSISKFLPVFHSIGEGKLGVALESLQGQRDLIYIFGGTAQSRVQGRGANPRGWGRGFSPACWELGFQAWAQSTCPELSALGLFPLRWGLCSP